MRSLAQSLSLATAVMLLLLALFCPRWNIFIAWARVPEFTEWIEVRRGATFVQQVAHPFAPVTDPVHQVVRWRLLFPLLGHALHLPPAVALALPAIGAWLALAVIAGLAQQRGCSLFLVFAGTITLGAAGWFFVSTGWLGYFDSWLLLGLLAISHGPRRWHVWAACLLGPWVDDRFVVGLPLALAVRCSGGPTNAFTIEKKFWPHAGREIAVPAVLAVVFVALRFWLASTVGSQGVGEYLRLQQAFNVPFSRQCLGLWESLRFGWAFVLAGAFFLARSLPAAPRAVVGIVFVVTMVVGFGIASDLSRSMTLLLPLAVEGLCRIGAGRSRATSVAAGVLAAASAILPARHVITDFVLPVPRLSAVIDAWRHPSGELAPATWVDRTNHLIGDGRLADARTTASIALRLNPSYGPAYNTRGFINARERRWAEALSDFRRACELEPEEASFWFNQAFALKQLGQTDESLQILAEAMKHAVPGSEVWRKIDAWARSGLLAP